MERIRLIALNLEGVLIDDQKQIAEQTRAVLLRAAEKGIWICMVGEGRYEEVRRIADDLVPGQPVLCAGGAAAYLGEPYVCVYCETLEQKQLRSVVELLEKEKVFYQVYCDDGSVMLTSRKSVSGYAREDGLRLSGDEMPKYVGDGALKILAVSEDAGQLARLRAGAEKLGDVKVAFSEKNHLQILRRDVEKGAALRALAERLEIPAEEIMTFGVSEEDVSMFGVSGWSFCLENGSDTAKAAARVVLASPAASGISEAILKYAFGEEEKA